MIIKIVQTKKKTFAFLKSIEYNGKHKKENVYYISRSYYFQGLFTGDA
ncbi:hypothetical protein SELSPUOL_00130 [Selenomonas sputigena ATCC 35185]|uniref:Uncharacterized protein n=1 Tax=Selenomonas sputigena (strain ATCC 35185 / DSM 20758 / CCUG 44933 / VPI D19B-28) TaxID=546271 RepID=C9LRR3_SELS3|nr:hypothetical protein SELSPUOL_00130 [Selenomonas sputigena ATCC 35185]